MSQAKASHPSSGRRTDPDASRLLRSIRALVRRFSIGERHDVVVDGMTIAQSATLEALATDGPLRMTDLGRRLGVAPSTLTRNLGRLEERGLVRRARTRTDGRSLEVALTARGRRAAAATLDSEEAFARSILCCLPPHRRDEVLVHLEALLVAVREATETCCPGAFDHLMREFPRAPTRTGEDDAQQRCDC